MPEFWYDIVAHHGGWAIIITPRDTDAFATRKDAFDTAADQARKLRFSGLSLVVRMPDEKKSA